VQILPYAGFLALGYVLTVWLQKGAPRGTHGAAIILIIAAFFWLKKYIFVPHAMMLSTPYVIVGLSYVFFRVLHLVIDAGSEDREKLTGPISYINYTLNFTSLVSGPIQFYGDYKRTAEDQPASLNVIAAGNALERIARGVFKVLVVAPAFGALQAGTLAHAAAPSDFAEKVLDAGLLVAIFPVYLFFNFSGYTDCVIGVARFFRIELPENFNRPYSAASFIEYWNRWHMTLSNWLKTYVYNPSLTVMMRRIPNPTLMPYLGAAALFVTFFLIGAWHGQTAHFYFFGLLNGLGVSVNQIYRLRMTKRLGRRPFSALAARPIYLAVGRGLTFTWVGFTQLWFWSDWPQLTKVAEALGAPAIILGILAVIAAATVVLTLLKTVLERAAEISISGAPVFVSRYTRTAWVTLMVLLIVGVQIVMQAPAPDVVYKNF
jgi:D-alanyl-lipoteichoic acid acyltransferase DltB (MBOAT superfamily)